MRARRARRAACLLVALGACLTAGGGVAADRALLVGVDDYSGTRLTSTEGESGAVGSLRGTLNDVASVRRLLEDGFGLPRKSILELTDREATHAAVLEAIDRWLIDGTRAGDRVFLHLSGHGTQVPDTNGDEQEDDRDEVFVTADADCLVASDGRTMVRCDNVLLDDELGERLERLAERHVLVTVDSCHSGTSTRSLFGSESAAVGSRLAALATASSEGASRSTLAMTSRGTPAPTRLIDGSANRVAMFAVSSAQYAAEVSHPDRGFHGLFSHHLVDGLLSRSADGNADGEVSFAELHAHVGAVSDAFCERAGGAGICAFGIDPQVELPDALAGTDVFAFGRGAPPGGEPPSTTDVTAVLPIRNEAGLEVEIVPGADFAIGEPMTLRIVAERSGMLLVFDRNAHGELTRLYPSTDTVREPPRPDGMPLGWIRAGAEVTMPDAWFGYDWPMAEPFGDGTIVVVLAEDFDTVAPLVASGRAFEPVPREEGDEWLARLREELDTMVATGDASQPFQPLRWSIATADYRVSP